MEIKMYFTVFTPTYNRGGVIERVYKSLCNQTFEDFEWVVVDDGSTDDTEIVMKSFLSENSTFPITYKKKENGGKHTAINMASTIAKGKFFFIVDSDDYLLPRSLENIFLYIKQIEENGLFAGVAGLRGNSFGAAWNQFGTGSGKTNTRHESKEYLDATSFDYRYKYKIYGDRAEVVRTELLKSHLFPEYAGENFVSEGVLWSALAHEGYLFRWFNTVVYITEEYRSDGLTKNIKEVHKRNPKGIRDYNNQLLGYRELPFEQRFRAGVGYFLYGKYAGQGFRKLFKLCNWKLIAIPCYVVSLLKK